jgi:hypothetical protein
MKAECAAARLPVAFLEAILIAFNPVIYHDDIA